jgi:hypothetical protein
MTNTTSRQRLLTDIETQQAEAVRLMTLAEHDTIKEQVRLAIRDLDEALHWLNEKNVDTRPSILRIADLAFGLATWRLTMVKNALDKYGPGAMLIG